MNKACSRCGKIHPYNYICTVGKVYKGGEERKLRNLAAWHRKSEEIRERANHLCEACRSEGIYTYNSIEVHHIAKVKNNKDLLLNNENLVCLCQYHHKLADKGDISPDFLRELARHREELT